MRAQNNQALHGHKWLVNRQLGVACSAQIGWGVRWVNKPSPCKRHQALRVFKDANTLHSASCLTEVWPRKGRSVTISKVIDPPKAMGTTAKPSIALAEGKNIAPTPIRVSMRKKYHHPVNDRKTVARTIDATLPALRHFFGFCEYGVKQHELFIGARLQFKNALRNLAPDHMGFLATLAELQFRPLHLDDGFNVGTQKLPYVQRSFITKAQQKTAQVIDLPRLDRNGR